MRYTSKLRCTLFHRRRLESMVHVVCTVLLIFLLLVVGSTNAQQIGGTESSKSVGHRVVSGISEGIRLTTKSFLAKFFPRRRPTNVKIVCVGFGRTGTTSFVQALKILNYTPVHDDERFEISDLMEDMFLRPIDHTDGDATSTLTTTTTKPMRSKMLMILFIFDPSRMMEFSTAVSSPPSVADPPVRGTTLIP